MARPREPIEHGTPAGYQKHVRRKVPHETCQGACREAWRRYNKARRDAQ